MLTVRDPRSPVWVIAACADPAFVALDRTFDETTNSVSLLSAATAIFELAGMMGMEVSIHSTVHTAQTLTTWKPEASR
jgi:DNA repair ATPase RecN